MVRSAVLCSCSAVLRVVAVASIYLVSTLALVSLPVVCCGHFLVAAAIFAEDAAAVAVIAVVVAAKAAAVNACAAAVAAAHHIAPNTVRVDGRNRQPSCDRAGKLHWRMVMVIEVL